MPIKFQTWIRREDLRSNRDYLYLFGDNAERRGLGGQAKEMRGEPNAIGIRTKWSPSRNESAYFKSDLESETRQVKMIAEDFFRVFDHLNGGGILVVPGDGLGTGLSQLEKRAPKTHKSIEAMIKWLCDHYGVIE